MLNVRDLEHRWYHYNIKRYYPYLFSVLAFVLLVIGISIFINSNSLTSSSALPIEKSLTDTAQSDLHVNSETIVLNNDVRSNKVVPATQNITEEPMHNTTVPIAAEKSQPIIEENLAAQPRKLQPSYSFMQNITTTPVKIETPKPLKQAINSNIVPAVEEHPKEATSIVHTKPKPQNEPAPVKAIAEKTPNGIKIDRTKTHQEIQDITRRFETNKNPALGLYLARYHYKMQNYKKSYNYALSTNNIDSNIEEGWLIFASSQVKLGQKDDAVKTLIAYIKSTDSMNAKNLLHSIRTGEFK